MTVETLEQALPFVASDVLTLGLALQRMAGRRDTCQLTSGQVEYIDELHVAIDECQDRLRRALVARQLQQEG